MVSLIVMLMPIVMMTMMIMIMIILLSGYYMIHLMFKCIKYV